MTRMYCEYKPGKELKPPPVNGKSRRMDKPLRTSSMRLIETLPGMVNVDPSNRNGRKSISAPKKKTATVTTTGNIASNFCCNRDRHRSRARHENQIPVETASARIAPRDEARTTASAAIPNP